MTAESSYEKHVRAVRQTLQWAHECAARGDFREALDWMRTLDAIGAQLPAEYAAIRQGWHAALQAQGQAEPALARWPAAG